MLPEIEKTIPKPLKKRYRDLFEDDGRISALGNSQNIPRDCIRTFAFSSNPSHIPEIKENINYSLHALSGSYYRKTVINGSISKHISIIDFEEISPKLTNSVNAPNTAAKKICHGAASDKTKLLTIDYIEASTADGSLDENRASPVRYISSRKINYEMNSSPTVTFTGKLKVKWREKYENLESFREDIAQHELVDSEREKVLIIEDKSKAFRRGVNKKPYKTNKNSTIMTNGPQNEQASVTAKNETSNEIAEEQPVRKLERARKGLIYQKFMASSYSWSRKEKSSKTTKECSQQPRKRGRPRTVNVDKANDDSKSSTTELNLKSTCLTLMRLTDEKNSRKVKYAVVDGEKSHNKSSSDTQHEKKLSDDTQCVQCGLTEVAEEKNGNKLKVAKFPYSQCKCISSTDFGIFVNEDDRPVKKRKRKRAK